jgi:hypothetical protein
VQEPLTLIQRLFEQNYKVEPDWGVNREFSRLEGVFHLSVRLTVDSRRSARSSTLLGPRRSFFRSSQLFSALSFNGTRLF